MLLWGLFAALLSTDVALFVAILVLGVVLIVKLKSRKIQDIPAAKELAHHDSVQDLEFNTTASEDFSLDSGFSGINSSAVSSCSEMSLISPGKASRWQALILEGEQLNLKIRQQEPKAQWIVLPPSCA